MKNNISEPERRQISGDDMGKLVYEQAMNLWIQPEIMSRYKKGQIKIPVVIHMAQIILGLDGTHKVRLNDEVRGKIKYRIVRDVRVGEAITYKDVDRAFLDQKAPEDLDFGHITIIALGDNEYSINFDFNYGAQNVLKYLRLGEEFLGQAVDACERSPRAAITLGMTAAENLLKARMAASPLVSLKSKTHSGLMRAFSLFVQQNRAKQLNPDAVQGYKFFEKHFNNCRYEPDAVIPGKDSLTQHLKALERISAETLVLTRDIEKTSLESRQMKIKSEPAQPN